MAAEKQAQGPFICEPMTVTQLSEKVNQSVVTIMMFLLKQGVIVAKNQLLTPEIVKKVADFFEIELVQPQQKEESITRAEYHHATAQGKVSFERKPVVVVVGHVDHGKTTLLDFIRKTRVAAREKGGITQHIGAYEAATTHGSIVFIDTPGHEAFSVMRARGISVADVAILVVAADNGVQPQTLEALSLIQKAKIPLIVAVNKIDKASQRQIDDVKTELSKHGLMPEDWGGETIYVPISALKGDGIEHLLEMIVLQAQMAGLTTYLDVPATGFVLESRFEKGRGAVATVICRAGLVHVGDFFIAGMTQGRISSLKDASGLFITEAKPSVPVQIAGFSDLPRAGDMFKIVAAEEMRAYKASASDRRQVSLPQMQGQERALRLIVKADTASSKEVLVTSLEKLSSKTYNGLLILSSGVGTITESDITLASDTGSMLIGLHVKAETKAVALAQSLGVVILLFDIIYKLLEHMEELAEKGRPVKKVLKKVGEARVLKVFDIKKLGIVAGAQIVEGVCNKTSTVKVYRANRLVGKGSISSLQRDRNSVKEVRKGFECAFMVDGFLDWQVDDRVECFNEIQES